MENTLNEFDQEYVKWMQSSIREDLKNRFESLLRSTNDPHVEDLLTALNTKGLNNMTFFDEPASGNHHDNSLGGLLKHSIAVFDQFVEFVKKYHLKIPDASVIKAALLHDLCKWHTYYPRLNKDGSYSKVGKFQFQDPLPLGHGEKSVIVVQEYLRLTDVEKLLIRFHMGPYDEYLKRWNDTALMKVCPEYKWLYLADNIVSNIEGGEDE